MLETEFIQSNYVKWQEYEKTLVNGTNNPDKLSEIYLNLSNDLSFANTHYPNRAVRLYLNNLTQKVYNSINVNTSNVKIIELFTKYLPQVFFATKNAMYFTIIVFIIGITIGCFSTIKDPSFLRIILSEEYVQQTLQNIDNGIPMAIYQNKDTTMTFWSILTNNMSIAAHTFLLGLIGGVGSLFFLLVNAIMVGSFQTMFLERGIIAESIFTIWTHGTTEFIAMFFACAAGFHLGASFLFPKTYTRLQSMQIAAKKSLFLILISMILLLIAAYIETYITGLDISYGVRSLFIIVPIIVYIFYVFLYPRALTKKHNNIFESQETLSAFNTQPLNFEMLSSNIEALMSSLQIYIKSINKFIVIAMFCAIVCTVMTIDFLADMGTIYLEDLFDKLPIYVTFIVINIISLYAYSLLKKEQYQLYKNYDIEIKSKSLIRKIGAFFILVISNCVVIWFFQFISSEFYWFIFFPIIMLHGAKLLIYPDSNIRIVGSFFNQYFSNFINLFLFLLIVIFINYVVKLPVWSVVSQIITLLIPMSNTMTVAYTSGFVIFSLFFLFFIIVPILYLSIGINIIRYYELHNATVLLNRINNIKIKTKRYGMEGEL